MTIQVHHGDMRKVLKRLKASGTVVDSVCTDPPYHLTSIVKRFSTGAAPKGTGALQRGATGFMGKTWDGGDIAFQPETWRLVFDLLPPGGHLIAFGGTRTFHRMACAIEDAGFDIRNMFVWLYGSGFPKSHDFGTSFDQELLQIDRHEDPKDWEMSRSHFATHWEGWGTGQKPALEPICFAQRPVERTIKSNVLAHGVGGINIDGCRIGTAGATKRSHQVAYGRTADGKEDRSENWARTGHKIQPLDSGRFPTNVYHDGSDVIVNGFPDNAGAGGRASGPSLRGHNDSVARGHFNGLPAERETSFHADSGSAARFFYSSKADKADRLESRHPTVKPVDVIQELVRLVTPRGGTVLDPFAGSGTTGMACMAEGFSCIMVEQEAEYVADIRRRIAHVQGDDTPLFSKG